MILESEYPVKVEAEFIEENKKLNFKNSKKGGRYSKVEKDRRQKEVYRLHFDYGYSGRKISEMMKISRNTVNSDIDYWYARIYRKTNIFNPENTIILNIQRLEIQRSRLREQLDKAESFHEKMSIERMIYEIDCKILYTHNRLAESIRRLTDFALTRFNEWKKDQKNEKLGLTLFDKFAVSKNAHEKIEKIINDDKGKLRHI